MNSLFAKGPWVFDVVIRSSVTLSVLRDPQTRSLPLVGRVASLPRPEMGASGRGQAARTAGAGQGTHAPIMRNPLSVTVCIPVPSPATPSDGLGNRCSLPEMQGHRTAQFGRMSAGLGPPHHGHGGNVANELWSTALGSRVCRE